MSIFEYNIRDQTKCVRLVSLAASTGVPVESMVFTLVIIDQQLRPKNRGRFCSAPTILRPKYEHNLGEYLNKNRIISIFLVNIMNEFDQ